MNGMTTVVVVHETAAPNVRCLVALCTEHVTILERAPWARVDDLVGFSTVMECEACTLTPESTLPELRSLPARRAIRRHLYPLPAKT